MRLPFLLRESSVDKRRDYMAEHPVRTGLVWGTGMGVVFFAFWTVENGFRWSTFLVVPFYVLAGVALMGPVFSHHARKQRRDAESGGSTLNG
jgi:hypothetical protein